jgi:hypothetical protein
MPAQIHCHDGSVVQDIGKHMIPDVASIPESVDEQQRRRFTAPLLRVQTQLWAVRQFNPPGECVHVRQQTRMYTRSLLYSRDLTQHHLEKERPR